MEDVNKTKEESTNMKVFPVLEEAESEYEKLCKRHFSFEFPEDHKIATMGIGVTATKEEMFELRTGIKEICKRYGYEQISLSDAKPNFTKMDKEIGSYIWENMNITPSVAASLPMWHFLNLCLIPDIIKWRWGDSKDHFLSSRRNYLGTQWWRYYLFNITRHTVKKYMNMNDRDIADLYERTNSRGLPEHIANISMWFEELDKANVKSNSQEIYREVLKLYNAKLAYRLYFSLATDERLELFSECYKECVIKL